MNSYLTRKNIITLAIIIILLLAIPLGLKLLQNQQTLRSKAAGGVPIAFQGPNVSTLNGKQIFRLDDQGQPTVGLTLTSPFGASGSSSVNSVSDVFNVTSDNSSANPQSSASVTPTSSSSNNMTSPTPSVASNQPTSSSQLPYPQYSSVLGGTISGQAFVDNNNDDTFDSGDQPIQAQIVFVGSSPTGPFWLNAKTNQAGNFSMPVTKIPSSEVITVTDYSRYPATSSYSIKFTWHDGDNLVFNLPVKPGQNIVK